MHAPRPYTPVTDAAIAACATPAERSVVLDLFHRARRLDWLEFEVTERSLCSTHSIGNTSLRRLLKQLHCLDVIAITQGKRGQRTRVQVWKPTKQSTKQSTKQQSSGTKGRNGKRKAATTAATTAYLVRAESEREDNPPPNPPGGGGDPEVTEYTDRILTHLRTWQPPSFEATHGDVVHLLQGSPHLEELRATHAERAAEHHPRHRLDPEQVEYWAEALRLRRPGRRRDREALQRRVEQAIRQAAELYEGAGR